MIPFQKKERLKHLNNKFSKLKILLTDLISLNKGVSFRSGSKGNYSEFGIKTSGSREKDNQVSKMHTKPRI